ncbi:Uncharacterised protein [BD1-7 clade bacterium]|uniref:IrrE N-terminal-like domain-containing protein n=1 Tax=BD1-7 clade bacterium TaxID=2029982 RepID=A0A5S9PJS8_9GAMM|nr:Uncharacterised protein [BD1-7 clade bacterium]CAA0104533.1 Uncharacterised protein [BD1-7 clade bacterium]
MNSENLVNTIVSFLHEIGLSIELTPLTQDTFLPGVCCHNGRILVDLDQLAYPGDILHEAGHLALLNEDERVLMSGDVGDDGGMEMGAIAWSYAASCFIGFPVEELFHQGGYKGDSDWLIEQFEHGTFIGLPILEWKQLTHAAGEKCYPQMNRWLC